jgi:hypothetical protein
MNVAMVNIRWMMKNGTQQLVMSRGHQVLMSSMKEMGILTMEHLLIQ